MRKYHVCTRKRPQQRAKYGKYKPQQIAVGYIQLSSMVLKRFVQGPFHQLPFYFISSVIPIGIPLVCEKHVLDVSQYLN